jgi:hypothetical protein
MPGLWNTAGIHCFIKGRRAFISETFSRAYTLSMYVTVNRNAFDLQIQKWRTVRHVWIYPVSDIDGNWLRGEINLLKTPSVIL